MPSPPPPALAAAGPADLDGWLAGLLGDEAGVALVAVGSTGRGDRAPFSDLDLVLLHRGRRDIAAVADRVWYPIWDAGIGLDHSVRTPKQVLAVVESDLKAAMGLLDGRCVAGDAELASDVLVAAATVWRKRARRWLPELAASCAERHARFGEVAFLLEPDLKEGKGGLRDVVALRAAARATPVLDGHLDGLDDAAAELAATRAALHRRARRATDRLSLQDQDGVATDRGYPSADALMGVLAQAARAVAWLHDDAWRRVTSALAGPRGRRLGREVVAGPGLAVRDGEIALTADADLSDPALPLLAAAAAADHGAGLSRHALRRFEESTPPPGDPWPPLARDALVAALGAGPDAIAPLEALDHHGLLARLLPEWTAVRHKPQRNAYHRFTVDRHLLECAARAAALTRTVARPDLLLVGALLHDIGKGFPGDHTDAGVEVVERVAARMGFPPADVDVLVAMVRHHLLLPDTATRRDLDDPATAASVAATVGSPLLLELLAALTEADSLATGPAAWSDWKAALVRTLVIRTAAVLAGDGVAAAHAGPHPGEPAGNGDRWDDLPEGLHGHDLRCTVVAKDRPGLLATVAGVLALHGLSVRSARAGSRADGAAVEVIDVAPPAGGSDPAWDRVAAVLDDALDGRLDLAGRLAERARHYAPAHPRAAARVAPPRVLVDNRASARATVLEVRAPDAVGLLHRVATALQASQLDIRSARLTTIGHEVVDAFYVADATTGAKVVDPDRLAAVEAAVQAAVLAALAPAR